MLPSSVSVTRAIAMRGDLPGHMDEVVTIRFGDGDAVVPTQRAFPCFRQSGCRRKNSRGAGVGGGGGVGIGPANAP